MKSETRTLWIGMSSLMLFLFANLFPKLLPSIGHYLESAGPSIWVILCLMVILIVQTALLLKKRKE